MDGGWRMIEYESNMRGTNRGWGRCRRLRNATTGVRVSQKGEEGGMGEEVASE